MDAAARDMATPEPVFADGEAALARPTVTTCTQWALPRPVAELG